MPPESRIPPRIDPKHWAVILHLPQEFGYECFIERRDGTGSAVIVTEIDHFTMRLLAVKVSTMRPVAFDLNDIAAVHIRSGNG